MRISASSGKSTTSRRETCSGLHAVAQRRSARCVLVQALPGRARSRNDGPVRALQPAAEPRVDVLPQPRVGHELGWLGASGRGLSLALRDRRPVLAPAAAGRGVAPQLARDRPRVTPGEVVYEDGTT